MEPSSKSESSLHSIQEESEYVDPPQIVNRNGKSYVSGVSTSSKVCNPTHETQLMKNQVEVMNQTDSTGVTQSNTEKPIVSLALPEPENEGEATAEENKEKKKKKKSIYNKKVVFYVKDSRYEIIKRIAKKEFEWRNTYKDEEDCNILWSDIGLQPERLQNMKPFQ